MRLYWRVNSLTPEGWRPSPTHVVMPCAATNLVANASCVDGIANVEFSWTPVATGADTEQWLEVSAFDNSFVNGTYRSVGPMSPEERSLTWEGLSDTILVWRLSTKAPWDWLTSATGTIPSCRIPALLEPRYACSADKAMVEFRWSPLAGNEGQWLDLSLTIKGFGEGAFVSAGPLAPERASFVWNDLLINDVHYYRINTISANGWQGSVTHSFLPLCPKP